MSIPKDQLEVGAYYWGTCRNASIARWNGEVFLYWRTKFGDKFVEEISHSEDEKVWDVFIPAMKVENLAEPIPLQV